MSTARLIVCEKTGCWANALARLGVRVYEVRGLPACREALSTWPVSFVALEATDANIGQMVEFIGDMNRRYPAARAAALCARDMAQYQWPLREAGAVHVVFSPRRLAPLVRLVERHLAAAPEVRLSLTERLMAELPWG